MKQKLLITLGCSFTEGVGCYDPELIKQYPIIDDNVREEISNKSIERFHANGWPPRLQQKLNYNKLINLGKGGTGESFQLKRFIEEFGGVDLSEEYDVLVIWLASPQGRLSFYVNGILYSILSNWPYPDSKTDNLAKAYVDLIENVDLDTCLEQSFYIKTLKEICNGKNYNFLIFPLGETPSKLNDVLKITENMVSYYTFPNNNEILPDMSDPHYSSIMNCFHPNENGYEMVAERMFEIIKKYNPSLINNEGPVVFEREWRAPKQWNLS